jgi:hypothetical protein
LHYFILHELDKPGALATVSLNPTIRREQPRAHFRQINKLVDGRLFQHAYSTHHPQGMADRRFPGFPIIEQHKISVQLLG